MKILFRLWFDRLIRDYEDMLDEGAFKKARDLITTLDIILKSYCKVCRVYGINENFKQLAIRKELRTTTIKEISNWINEEKTKLNRLLESKAKDVNISDSDPEFDKRIYSQRADYIKTSKMPDESRSIQYIDEICLDRTQDRAIMQKEPYVNAMRTAFDIPTQDTINQIYINREIIRN